MAVNVSVLIPAKNAETAQTTQYTAGAVRAIIDKFTATNTTAAAVTISVNLVTSGDAAGSPNLVLKTKSLAAGETYTCPEVVGHTLAPGGFISTIAGATGVTIRCSGREVS